MLQSQRNKATISILGKLRQKGNPGSIQGASMIPTPIGEDPFQDPEDQALEGEADIESGDTGEETLNDMSGPKLVAKKKLGLRLK